ncbi:MAG: M20 family metallopeptidase [Trueperaceae bacterium]
MSGPGRDAKRPAAADPSALAERAAAAVDADRLVAWTQALVRIRSVVDPERGSSEQEAATWVADTLRELGFSPTIEEVAPGRPNVICDWSGSRFDPERHRTLMFEGHTDVVTEGDRASWSVDPFGGAIDGDRLYGRGAADMKGGVAAAIAALCAVREVAPDLPGRIRLGIVVDEEGMMSGIKSFIENGWAREVDGAIVCEPEENELCLVQKGALRLHVRVVGAMAHGAMPYAGVNPVRGLAHFLVALEELEQREQQRLGEHPHLGRPWITPTMMRAPDGGTPQLNVMPGNAYQAIDVRTVPGQDHDALLAEIQAAARATEAGTPGLTIEVECFASRPWTETAADDPLVSALAAAYPGTIGGPARYGGVPGATDGTFLSAWAQVPIVTVGPGDRTIPHQSDEFVRVPDLILAARLYAAAAVRYLGEAESAPS